MKNYTIYILIDPTTNKPFYVGSTTTYLKQRLAVHMWSVKKRRQGTVSEYIKMLGEKPIIKAVDYFEATKRDALIRELHWLYKLRGEGNILVNDNKPFDDHQPAYVSIPQEDIEFLRSHTKYYAAMKRECGKVLAWGTVNKVIKSGSCRPETLARIKKYISLFQDFDCSKIDVRHRCPMVCLSPEQIIQLKSWAVSCNLRKESKELGVDENTIRRIIKTGRARHDKYQLLSKIL